MFVDEAKICLVSGRGGDGLISFHRDRSRPKGGPGGGDGGRGGNVVLEASLRVRTLVRFTQRIHWKAGKGEHGGANRRRGRDGKDLVVHVPVGTTVKDLRTGEVLADLSRPGQRAVLARGGEGGRGNTHFKSPERRAPRIRERGEPGEERWVALELKLLADVGLIGHPNAGKSTLLSAISAKRPKIAAYPFTTLEPHLGVVQVDEERSFVAVDIPGLIKGAHAGKGLGDRFLKHVERTRLLVHLVDASGWEGRDPLEDYHTINRELSSYSEALAEQPQIVCGNKIDLLSDEALADVQRRFAGIGVELLPISALERRGVRELVYRCQEVLERLEGATERPLEPEGPRRKVYRPKPPEGRSFSVVRNGTGFHVRGPAVDRLSRLSLEEQDALDYLQEQLEATGVLGALEREGIREGDRVFIDGLELVYRSEG